jgi:hypothetical protein
MIHRDFSKATHRDSDIFNAMPNIQLVTKKLEQENDFSL